MRNYAIKRWYFKKNYLIKQLISELSSVIEAEVRPTLLRAS